MKVGFIGLGIMGAPMAGHLIKGGHELFLNTRTKVPDELIAAGGTAWIGEEDPLAELDRVAAANAGVDDFLAKPFSALQLMAKVRDFVPDALAG